MFLIDKASKKASEIGATSFKEHGLKERSDLQEWIAGNPSLLREELLIIQKEFSQFEGTNERLDLLALDKDGVLVVIENKLDYSGKDVVWQALKYASYFAACEENKIVELFSRHRKIDFSTAQQEIMDFLERETGEPLSLIPDQRIILVAGEFPIEVTSVVLWLIDRGLQIKCIKVTPFTVGDHFIVDSEQIIPLPEKSAEAYRVKVNATKRQAENRMKDYTKRFTDCDEFYATIAVPHIQEVFSRLFHFSEENRLSISWGRVGFSLNIPLENNTKLSLLEGYGGNAKKPYELTVKNSFLRKINNSDAIFTYYENEIKKLSFFKMTSSSNYVWNLEGSTLEQMESFFPLLHEVIKKVREEPPCPAP